MAQKRVAKLNDAFPDFVDEADRSLDQILDAITASNSPFTDGTTADLNADLNSVTNFYQNKISETCDDILRLEKNAATIIQANIENLYKGSFVREYAAQSHITEAEAREQLRFDLASQFHAWGMKCINKRHYALPREIKHIIRMDFYGTVNKINEQKDTKKKLSETYRQRNPKQTAANTPADYDLSRSPTWTIFRQFRSFRLLERNLPELLIKEGISPRDIKRLNAYDFSQILYNHYITKSKPDAEKAERANLFLGAKYRFVKAFIRRNKTSLRRVMELRGYNPRYTETLIRHMEQYGVTGGFNVLETNYTSEMLEPLKKRGLISPETKAGDPITDEQAAAIRAAGFLNTILAHDANGNPITGPELTVHHKVAVQDSGEKTSFSEVNQFKNLCLIIEPYHFFAHSLDRTGTVQGAEYYVSRIEIGEDLAFYGGFNKLFQIECNFGQTHYKQYDKEALNSFRSKQILLEKSDEYWQPKNKISCNEKKQQKKLKQKCEEPGKIAPKTAATNAQSQPKIKQLPKKEQSAAAVAIPPKPQKNTSPNLLKRMEKISRQKDEYLRLRSELIEKRKQYLALRAAKKSAIKIISQFEDDQKFKKFLQYTLRAQRGRK